MKPAAFLYHDPATIPETLDMLASCENAKVLAGGQSLMPMMNFRYVMPDHLIDINRVGGLDHIRVGSSGLQIGAMARQRALEFSPEIRNACPLLWEAVPHIGHRQTRNRGTLGGSLAHADPAAELPLVALALDAVVRVQSVRGPRSVPMADFVTGYLTTALQPDELLVGIDLPARAPGQGFAFVEFSRRPGDFALASCAVVLAAHAEGSVRHVAIALSGMGARPLRLPQVEQMLPGEKIHPELLRDVASLVAQVEASGDMHATAEYRRHLAQMLVVRALLTASRRMTTATRAQGHG